VTRSLQVNAKSTGASVGKFADVVGLLWRVPRTVNELERLTGISFDTLSRYITLLKAEGLLVESTPRPRFVVYKWVDRS
jgi:Fic family protein